VCTAVFAAGVLGVAVGGPASAEVPSRTRTQIATPPPPGSGITIIVGGTAVVADQPQPLGPLSFT
jgi:hypothetical protein